jgi:RiboL-PSP-HEPN
MQNPELIKQYTRLNRLIQKTRILPEDEFELRSHWGKYLCVLVSGFLENAISEVYCDFVSKAASPHVIQYTMDSLSKIQNPKAGRFVEIAHKFKKEWGIELEKYFSEDSSRKEAIDMIMTNRHLIAHGKDSDITISKVAICLERSLKVIEFIENQCANRLNP